MATSFDQDLDDDSSTRQKHIISPFPSMDPETRMMMRSIPFSHLRGYGSQPNVIGATAKVDSHNSRYHRPSRSTSERTVSPARRSNYSHVTSKIDTGRKKRDIVKQQSCTVSESAVLVSQLASTKRRLAQLQRSATLPTTSTRTYNLGTNPWNRKLSVPVTHRARKPAISRVDCSNPHPEVTRQTHSLQELQIVPDLSPEELNPRLTPSSNTRLLHRARTFSLPAHISTPSIQGEHISTKKGTRNLQKSSTFSSVNPNSTRADSIGKIATQGRLVATNTPKISKSNCSSSDSRNSETKISKSCLVSADTSTKNSTMIAESGDRMDVHVGTQIPLLDDIFNKNSNEKDDGDIVKMKPSLQHTRRIGGGDTDTENHHHSYYVEEDIKDTASRQESSRSLRDSVSSSESVGITPECYNTMEINTDAFSVDEDMTDSVNDTPQPTWVTKSDKIVGFEVSTDSTQTTVNLLHLLGNKSNSAEQTHTDYQDSYLWVIGEEDEEEEEDEESEMEEEICLATSGDSSNVAALVTQNVPQLFIMDENNTIVEEVKTGRRKLSKGSSSNLTSSTDCSLNLHKLTLHD